jgi:hypothetical protein
MQVSNTRSRSIIALDGSLAAPILGGVTTNISERDFRQGQLG